MRHVLLYGEGVFLRLLNVLPLETPGASNNVRPASGNTLILSCRRSL